MKDRHPDFASALQSFFSDYMVRERASSSNTIRSYRDTFVLLIDYMDEVRHIPPDRIKLADFERDMLTGYLDWLEEKHHNSISTRNQRCAALRSFFKYMMYLDPTHMSTWKQICTIKMKKYEQKPVAYLTIEAMKCLLEQVETDNKGGRRNLAMLSLLYNTGARVQELIDLTPRALRLTKPYTIELLGKGSKRRLVPLDDAIVNLMVRYMEENHLTDSGKADAPLFSNSWGEPLTNPGISYIISKYAAMARQLHPELYPEKITPHVFRHSRAMHLLQAGVNLVYIRDILGHVSIQTTEIYARADSKQKREALEKAYESVGITEPAVKSWENNPKLKELLKSFC